MTLQLDTCRLVFPEWYDERAEYEAEQKGWLQGVRVELPDGEQYSVHFYDLVRLGQDLDEEAKWDRPFVAEPGLIVVPAVSREAITSAVNRLAITDYFRHLRSEAEIRPLGYPLAGGSRNATGTPTESVAT